MKHLTSGGRTYIINSQGEYEGGGFEEITWEDASDRRLENCNLVFEDLIGVRAKETKLIKKFVHFLLRRKNIHMFLLAHEIHNTGLFSLVHSMDEIYITSGRKNEKTLRDLRRLIKYEPLEPSNFPELKHHYLKIDVPTGKSVLLNNEFEKASEAEQEDLASKRRNVLSIVSCLPESDMLMKLFDMVFKVLTPSHLNSQSLCIAMQSGSNKISGSKVHIVDFLAALRSEEAPSKDIANLKRFMDKKGLAIPQLLIRNPFLANK